MNATPALPIAGAAVPPASESLARIRAMLAPWLTAPRRIDRDAVMWGALTERERSTILKAARLAPELHERAWQDFGDDDRAAIADAWRRLREWVERVELAIEQAGRR